MSYSKRIYCKDFGNIKLYHQMRKSQDSVGLKGLNS